jgi:DUF971 family protein
LEKEYKMENEKLAPTLIELHQKSRLLEIEFNDGKHFRLPYEFLRVYSPSAEVRGHGPGQETLQLGKKEVEITAAEPVGMYAINFTFSDGHDSGIYTWEYLHHMGIYHDEMWHEYLDRLQEAGGKREPEPNLLDQAKKSGCGSGGCGSH